MMKASIAALVGGDQKVDNYVSSNKKSKAYRCNSDIPSSNAKNTPFSGGQRKKLPRTNPGELVNFITPLFFLAVITKTIVFYIRSPLPKLTRRAAVRFRISCSGQIFHLPTSPPNRFGDARNLTFAIPEKGWMYSFQETFHHSMIR